MAHFAVTQGLKIPSFNPQKAKRLIPFAALGPNGIRRIGGHGSPHIFSPHFVSAAFNGKTCAAARHLHVCVQQAVIQLTEIFLPETGTENVL